MTYKSDIDCSLRIYLCWSNFLGDVKTKTESYLWQCRNKMLIKYIWLSPIWSTFSLQVFNYRIHGKPIQGPVLIATRTYMVQHNISLIFAKAADTINLIYRTLCVHLSSNHFKVIIFHIMTWQWRQCAFQNCGYTCKKMSSRAGLEIRI